MLSNIFLACEKVKVVDVLVYIDIFTYKINLEHACKMEKGGISFAVHPELYYIFIGNSIAMLVI